MIDIGNINVTGAKLIDGNALNPSDTDTIMLEGTLNAREPVPKGWRVLDGNIINSRVVIVVLRYEVENIVWIED